MPRRKHKFYELHGYKKKIYVFFWGILSLSRWGFVIWPRRNHGGWQFHLHMPYTFYYKYSVWRGLKQWFLPHLTWSHYWLVPKRASRERRIMIVEWFVLHVWLDLWAIGKIKRSPYRREYRAAA
jgi:hypothetical protein